MVHVPQWKIPHDTNKIPLARIRNQCNQINKYLNKNPMGFLPARNRIVGIRTATLIAGEEGENKEKKKLNIRENNHMLWCFKIKQKYWLCVLIKEEQPHAISQIRSSYGYCTLGSRRGGKCHFKELQFKQNSSLIKCQQFPHSLKTDGLCYSGRKDFSMC